jgi:hypothetical protein
MSFWADLDFSQDEIAAMQTDDQKVAALRTRGIFIDYADRVREGRRQQADIIARVWPERA